MHVKILNVLGVASKRNTIIFVVTMQKWCMIDLCDDKLGRKSAEAMTVESYLLKGQKGLNPSSIASIMHFKSKPQK